MEDTLITLFLLLIPRLTICLSYIPSIKYTLSCVMTNIFRTESKKLVRLS